MNLTYFKRRKISQLLIKKGGKTTWFKWKVGINKTLTNTFLFEEKKLSRLPEIYDALCEI